MVFQIILNSRKYAPFEKTPSLLLTPKFLHRFFPHVNTPYRASSGNFHSVVDWVHEYINTKLLSPCFLATAKFFVARTGNACLHESSPLTTDEASCFGASWLSINASAADFPYYNFSEATVLSEGHTRHRDCWIHVYSGLCGMEGECVCMRRTEYLSKWTLPILSKSSVKKGGVFLETNIASGAWCYLL